MARLLPWLEGWRLLLLLLLGAGIASAILGPDRSWDTRNYHLYLPWSVLIGRPGDVLPAGVQSFHNPTLDLPFALLVLALNDLPWLVSFVMGLPTGLALWLVWRISRAVLAGHPAAQPLSLLAMLGAAGGAVLRAQVGTASGDVASGVLVLGALLPALAAATRADWRRAALAGLLCGAAIGLKLTNAPYAVALAVLLALAPGAALGARARMLAACAAGGLAGLLLAYGWWGASLRTEFGNPIFPYFQALLVPGWEGSAIGRDARFLPEGVLDALTRPFRWAVSGTPIATEERMRDPRIAAGLLAALALALLPGRPALLRRLAAFFLVGFTLWSGLFGIYRYAFVLEALAPLLVLGALAPLLPGRRRWGLPALAGLTAVAAVATIPYPSGRAVPAARYLDLAWPRLPADAVVLPVEPPVAFAGLGLPPGIPLASPNGVGEVRAEVFRARLRAILDSGRPLYLLSPAGRQGWERLADWGLAAEPGSCRRICTNWSAQGVGPMVCAVHRAGEAPPPAPDWPDPRRLCEAAAGLGLESGGRRGLAFAGEARLAFGAGCAEAEIRVVGSGVGLRTEPPAVAGGAPGVLRVAPAADGMVRLLADAPVTLAQAACLRR